MDAPKKYVASVAFTAIAVVVGIIILTNSTKQQTCHQFNDHTLVINQETISVELAETAAEQQQGLAGCSSLSAEQGMYFKFSSPRNAVFWMKGMLIPIDIIWLSNDTVVGVLNNVPPPDDPDSNNLPRYSPPRPVDAVLELAAGQATKRGIDVGTTILLP